MIRSFRELMIRDDLRRWIALLVVCFAQLMIILDSTIVNVALPAIQRDLGFRAADLTWVVNAYGISYGGFVLLAGRVGDVVGRKRVFLAGVALFTLASAICGSAQAAPLLVGARFVQGLGAALSAGVILAIITTGFPAQRERAQAMSVFAFTIAGGGSLGLLAGGFLTQAASWHWDFFINLPIGLATFVAGWVLIESNEGPGLRRGVDVAGSILATAAPMLAIYAIVTADAEGWTSAYAIASAAASLVLLSGFLWLQARLRNPILPLRILGIRTLMGASAARGLVATGIFSTFFLGALYLQQVRGYSAMQTGLAFLPFTLGLAAMSLGITVRLVGRFGPRRVLLAGLLCITSALLILASVGPDTAYFPRLFATYGLFGLGAGMTMMPLTLIAMAEVPPADAGLAAGITNVSMQVPAAFGLAVLGTVAADHSRSLLAAGVQAAGAMTGGYQLAFTIAAALVAGAVVVVLTALRIPAVARPAHAPAGEDQLELPDAA